MRIKTTLNHRSSLIGIFCLGCLAPYSFARSWSQPDRKQTDQQPLLNVAHVQSLQISCNKHLQFLPCAFDDKSDEKVTCTHRLQFTFVFLAGLCLVQLDDVFETAFVERVLQVLLGAPVQRQELHQARLQRPLLERGYQCRNAALLLQRHEQLQKKLQCNTIFDQVLIV